ncbi:MAG: response regulator [Planctomycetes bacterium]|nr:response regulator [Planctomycetota bacterium]
MLVIDDEAEMLRLFRVCLTARGYRVTTARDGEAGLELAELEPPGIVILDLMLPGMSGREVCRRLRSSPVTATIPILVVSGEDPVEGGALVGSQDFDDFITKPFRHDELMARVDALVQRGGQTAHVGPDEQRRLQILRSALRLGRDSLIPHYDSRTPSGYAYPATAEIAAGPTHSDFLADLEVLAEQGHLEATFHDAVLTCPACGHHDVHFREVCLDCGSADLETEEMIHHYRCSHVGPIREFRKGRNLVCPKCEGTLRHIGIDYQKPADALRCRSCGRFFQDPDVAARCRNCNQTFPAENVQRKRICSYAVTPAGQAAAAGGHPASAPGGARQDGVEVDEVYRLKFLRELIQQEVARSAAEDQSIALLRVGVRGLDVVFREGGQPAVQRVLRGLVHTIRSATRVEDKLAQLRPEAFVLVIPGADARTAAGVARRIAETFVQNREGGLEKVALSYAWVVHPGEVADADRLLDHILKDPPSGPTAATRTASADAAPGERREPPRARGKQPAGPRRAR